MTIEQAIQELQAIVDRSDNPDGFYTTRQYSIMMGTSHKTAQERLRLVMDAGRLERARIKILGLRGWTTTDAYRIMPDP